MDPCILHVLTDCHGNHIPITCNSIYKKRCGYKMSLNIVTVTIKGSAKEQLATVTVGWALQGSHTYTCTCMDHTAVDDVLVVWGELVPSKIFIPPFPVLKAGHSWDQCPTLITPVGAHAQRGLLCVCVCVCVQGRRSRCSRCGSCRTNVWPKTGRHIGKAHDAIMERG